MQSVNPNKVEGKPINITTVTVNIWLLPKGFYSLATGKSSSAYPEIHNFTFDGQGIYMLLLYNLRIQGLVFDLPDYLFYAWVALWVASCNMPIFDSNV